MTNPELNVPALVVPGDSGISADAGAKAPALRTDAGAPALPVTEAVIESVLEESRFEWSSMNGTRTTTAASNRICLSSRDRAAVLRTRLAWVGRDAPGDVLAALAHFLVALNGRLRFARAVLDGDEVVLESVLPLVGLVPSDVDRAVEALVTGAVAAKAETAALSSGQVAHRYLAFHTKGRNDYADAHR